MWESQLGFLLLNLCFEGEGLKFIMSIKSKIFRELEVFCKEYFSTRDYFALVYGSFASDDFREDSDLDLFVAVKDRKADDFEKLRDFFIDLNARNNLKINEEVPYKNKLIVTYKDAADAIDLKAFIKSGAKYIIPPVTAGMEFLASKEVRFRIILNALTSPNQYICGNKGEYVLLKKEAEVAIMRLACNLTEKSDPNPDEILGVLLEGKNGEKSGDYLGYRNHRPRVMKYLKELISRNKIH